MGMSAKSRAILTAESKNEWNWFMKDLATAKQDYAADLAVAEEKGDKRSGWQKLIGTLFFVAAAAKTFVLPADPTNFQTLTAAATAAGWGAAAGTAASGGTALAQKGAENLGWMEDLKVLSDEYKEDIHQPLYGKGQAEYQTIAFETEMEEGTRNLDDWYDKAWETALYENVGRGSSFMSMFPPKG